MFDASAFTTGEGLVLNRSANFFFGLALQLLFLKASESMGNHDSEVVGACSVD